MSGGIAHDFNNLLTVILGNLEIVRKRMPGDPKITQLLDNATQGALRGVSLTQRLLAFARRQKLTTEKERAQDITPVTNSHPLCRRLLDNTNYRLRDRPPPL